MDAVPGPPVTFAATCLWPRQGALPPTQTCDAQEDTAPTMGGGGKTQRGRWVERSRLRAPAQSSLWAHRTDKEL